MEINSLLESVFNGEHQIIAGLIHYHSHWLFIPNLINMSDIVDLGPHFESSRNNLARFVLGIGGLRRHRPLMMSNWRAEYLTFNQVQYAVVDAYVSFQVGRILNIWQIPNCWSLGFV
ncbi:hypothetical protein MKW92_036276 [Papaver armeniacum]|nr:hypothetical protein MKW92_036276 [Papaver armeniacum]